MWVFVVGTAVRATAQAPPPQSATGTILGLVEAPDGHPVAGASVTLAGPMPRTAVADDRGQVTFADVAAGVHSLSAEFAGFGRADQTVSVAAGLYTRVTLRLPMLPFAEVVTVTATRHAQRLGESPTHVTLLTGRDINTTPALALDSTLAQVPGFSLFRRTSSLAAHPTSQGVSLRGIGASGASRTLVLVDGVPLNDAFGNWVYWNKIPQGQLESVEVAPGGLSAIYGSSALAGVISVVTSRPSARTITMNGLIGSRRTREAEGVATQPMGPVSILAGGACFDTDGYTLVREDLRGPVDVPASATYRTGNWRIDGTPSGSVSLFHAGRLFSERRRNGTPLQSNDSGETFLGVGLRATTPDDSRWEANVFGHDNTFDSTYSAVSADRHTETLSLAQAVAYDDLGGNAQWTRAMGAHRVSVGIDGRRVRARNNEDVYAAGVNVRDRIIPGKQQLGGLYAQDHLVVGRLSVVAGVRADHWRNYAASRTEIVNATGATTTTSFPETTRTAWTPRLGLIAPLAEGLSVRGSVSRGFRAPSLNELYRPFRVGNVVTDSNADLGPERLAEVEAGVNHSVNPELFWRASAFWSRLDDPIANVTISQTPALITRQRKNLGRAVIRGVSVEADYRPGASVRLQGAYLLSDARVDRFPADPTLEGKVLPQVPTHRASMRLDYLGPRLLTATAIARLDGRRFDDDLNQLPLAKAFLVDVRVERAIAGAAAIFLSLENAFDGRYAVQITPVELVGTPRTVFAGLRVTVRPRSRTKDGPP